MLPSRLAPVCAVLATLLLGACSGEPSEPDIQAAFQRRSEQQSRALESMLGTQVASVAGQLFGEPEVRKARKIGCKADGDQAYHCDVELEVQVRGQARTQIRQVRFVKGSEGWVIPD